MGGALLAACGPGLAGGGESDTGATEGGEACTHDEFEVPTLETPEVCESYSVDPPLSYELRDIPVEIVNARDDGVLLFERGIGCQREARWFSLTGTYEGNEVTFPASSCLDDWPSCPSFTDDPPGCLQCQTIIVPIYIEPGGRFTTTWTAAGTIAVELPADCSSSGRSEACWAPTPLPRATYALEARAQPIGECDFETCACDVDQDGSCPLESAINEWWEAEDATLAARADWSSECETIELRFE